MNINMLKAARNFYAAVACGQLEMDGYSLDCSRGMCFNLERYLRHVEVFSVCDACEIEYTIETYTKKWAKFSGCVAYPVPQVSEWGPSDEYDVARDNSTMYSGEYGRLRLELAGHIAMQLAYRINTDANEVGLWAITQYKIRRVLEQAVRGEADGCLGLCCLIGDATPFSQRLAVAQWREGCFVTWPEFSGDIHYPVPSPHVDYTAQGVYAGNLHKYDGEYGAARIRLAQYMLSTLHF